MSITKAVIKIEAGAGIGGAKNEIQCMFNPEEFTVSKGATWNDKRVRGMSQPRKRFVSSTPGSFDLTLIFDTTTSGTSVCDHTDLLLLLVEPNKNFPPTGVVKRPPFVWFSWGDWVSFKSVVSNVAINFTYFASNGTPLRAKAAVSFVQPEDDPAWPLQNPTSHTPLPHRLHRVQRGESLDRIAATYYGDPTDWRRIAEVNAINDPIRLAAGALLIIPQRGPFDD